jgi:hypothetical protein
MTTLLENTSIETFQLSIEQTVPRSLVHKRSLENVLVTELRAYGDARFVCAGRIPTAHRFFNDAGRTPQKDILFYTELGRQASLAVSHTFLGISREDVFIFEGSQARLTEAAWKAQIQPHLDSVVTEIRVHEIERRRNNVVNRVVAEHIMFISGTEVFRGTGAWTVQPAALFQRLRRLAKTRPASSSDGSSIASTRRRSYDNVVILPLQPGETRTQFATSLLLDETHPYFFDHPCDHVPGMLLLEGSAQLAKAVSAEIASASPRDFEIAGYDVNFQQFVECDAPVTLTAGVDADETKTDGVFAKAHVSISQHNVVCGTATLNVALSN